MNQIHTGGCHCGVVRYTVTAAPELTFYCHCRDCQKTTGSPFSVEMMIPDTGFEISGGLASYVVTGDSGKPVTRWHCADCASGIYLTCASDPGYVFLKAGTLDDPSVVSPEMHIYCASRQPWLHFNDDLPAYDKAPD